MPAKYVFITGGVVSGIGKGITAASLGRLLKSRGYKVTNQKFDPYINIDPGAMSPYQHGEVFVTDDGAETDLDIGHYERFVDENLTVNSNVTSGKIYWSVMSKERRGEYGGETVQVIPHITNEIKHRIITAGKSAYSDFVITEIGGTVGDMEGLPFFEAIRQIAFDVGRENVLYVHVTLIPYISTSGEMKTKPTQHSVKELLSIGIQPDIIVCRTEKDMSREMKEKLALFCNVSRDCVIQNMTAPSLYEVPLMLEDENFAEIVCKKLSLPSVVPDLAGWRNIVSLQKNITKNIRIALIGNYVELHDAYLSLVEALNHACIHSGCAAQIDWISAKDINDKTAAALLEGVNCVIIHGGFGEQTNAGMISALRRARENKIPALGICLGMQCMAEEFDQNAAHCTENPVIDMSLALEDPSSKRRALRLGIYPCKIAKDTLLHTIYGAELIYERHRHSCEFNINCKTQFVQAGMIFSGMSPDETLVEAIELPQTEHPWYIGIQFQPEFKSRPMKPHPLFMSFIKAGLEG